MFSRWGDAGTSERMLGTHLQQHVDERAGLEVLGVEPLVEHVEDGQQLPKRGGGQPRRLGFDDVHGPPLLAVGEERQCQVVLGGEVVVQRGLGDPGASDDLVHSHVT